MRDEDDAVGRGFPDPRGLFTIRDRPERPAFSHWVFDNRETIGLGCHRAWFEQKPLKFYLWSLLGRRTRRSQKRVRIS